MAEFNSELCDQKHGDLDRRVGTVERILERVEGRPPIWATILITVLGSCCTGLLVALVK